jgi:hypothetical protein
MVAVTVQSKNSGIFQAFFESWSAENRKIVSKKYEERRNSAIFERNMGFLD